MKIEHSVKTTRVGKILGWFTKNSIRDHFYDLLEWIQGHEHPDFEEPQWDALLEIDDSEEWQEMFCSLVGAYYACAVNFNEADSRFNSAVEIYLRLFNIKSLTFMISEVEKNNQTYWRSRASIDHKKIVQLIREIEADFNVSKYPNFARTIESNETKEEA